MIGLDPCLEWLYKKSGGFGTEIYVWVSCPLKFEGLLKHSLVEPNP